MAECVLVEIVSEIDLELIDAVQVEPRATWATISSSLDISAATAARRWAALESAGVAWTGATLGSEQFRGAIVEMRCAPGSLERVREALCSTHNVYTLGRVTGDYDFYALTIAPTPARLRDAHDDFSRLGLHGFRLTVYSRVFGGPRWKLGVLNRSQVDAVRGGAEHGGRTVPVSRLEVELFGALAADGRRSLKELGDELGMSPGAVGRRLRQIRRTGSLDIRADVARPLAGWPWAALVWVRAPDSLLAQMGHDVGSWPEVRFCAPVISATNLLIIVNLRHPEELESIGARLVSRYPQAEVVERRVILRLDKVHGHLLDDAGRSVGLVAMQPWTNLEGGGSLQNERGT